MAAKNARSGHQGGTTGDTPGSAANEPGAIRELIDGGGSRTPDGTNAGDGDASGGSKQQSGSGGSASAGSAGDGGSSERKGGGSGAGSGATGTASSGGTRNRSRSSGRSSGSAASQETRHSNDDSSRPISPPKQPKIDADIDPFPSANAEIIGDVFAFTFWGIGQATGIPQWELEDDDAATIGKNGEKWLKSLGKKRAQNVVKLLGKVGPSLAFFGSVGMALVPRIKLTINTANNGAIRPIQERTANRNGGGNTRQSASSVSPATTGNASDIGSAAERSRSFTAADFGEVTQGFAGLDDGLPTS